MMQLIDKQKFTKYSKGMYNNIAVMIVATFILNSLFIIQISNCSSDVDNLISQFEGNFGLTSQHMGLNPNGGQPGTLNDADVKVRALYTTIEDKLLQARQQAALTRSSITSYTIKSLKLM